MIDSRNWETRLRALIVVALVLVGMACATSTPSTEERAALGTLASRIDASVVYGHGGRIHKMKVGETRPADLGPGKCARFSPDGRRLAVFDGKSLFVMDADGANRREVAGNVKAEGCPMAFLGGPRELVYWREPQGFMLIDVDTRFMRRLDTHGVAGSHPSLSSDGHWLVARDGKKVRAVDLTSGKKPTRDAAAAAATSPDGRWILRASEDRTLAFVEPCCSEGKSTEEDGKKKGDGKKHKGAKKKSEKGRRSGGEGRERSGSSDEAQLQGTEGAQPPGEAGQAGSGGTVASPAEAAPAPVEATAPSEAATGPGGAAAGTPVASRQPSATAWPREAFVLDASVCRPDRRWEHHRWSNQADYVVAVGSRDARAVCVVNVLEHRGVRVSWEPAAYPDLYVTRASGP